MNEADRVELARLVAQAAHRGQSRKGGEPYFNHVNRVGLGAYRLGAGLDGLIVGYLHDTVEDTGVGIRTLRTLFGTQVAEDVDALSRRGHETYREFVDRTIYEGSDTALLVKLADLHDNMTDPAKVIRGDRYQKADMKIRKELRRRGLSV